MRLIALMVCLFVTLVLPGCGGGGGAGTGANPPGSSPITYTVGGTLSGLTSGNSITLLDNGSDALILTSNNTFTFATPLPAGSAYSVSVSAHPSGQNCYIGGGSGTIGSSTVTNIVVSCSPARQWAWIGGATSYNATGTYGTQGVAAASNSPGARTASVSWKDGSGIFWMYGGMGVDNSTGTTIGMLNDLWKFDPSTSNWTWVNGSNTAGALPVYGTKGVAATTNTPGARENASAVSDSAGNLWLFGGNGSGGTYLNDLWKFNIASGMWTWVAGSNVPSSLGNYGTKGTAASTNVPGGRYSTNLWIDGSGNLWVFGGMGYDQYSSIGPRNDLWKFDPASSNWTWISGSNTGNSGGQYGTLGVPSAQTTPGGRQSAVSWTDPSGDFWLFSGLGLNGTGSGNNFFLNELWKFSPSTGQWTWFGGSSAAPQGDYGTLGVPASTNLPPGRYQATSWIDTSGNLWLFGGSRQYNAVLNDVWKYDRSAAVWTWMGGSNDNTSQTGAAGIYGTQGVSAANNAPGARANALAQTDASGNVWLFGGENVTANLTPMLFNDMWKFGP